MRFRGLPRRFLVGGLGLVALLAAGCDTKAMRFNNALSDYNQRLNAVGRQFGEALRPALQGGSLDPERLRATHEAAYETYKEVKQEFDALPVPPSESARRLAEGYRRFLRGQQAMIRDDMGRIVRMVQTPAQARSSASSIIRILLDLQRREQRDLSELQNLQREFAREHRLPLLPAR